MVEALGVSSLKFNIMQPTARGLDLFQSGDALNIFEIIRLGKKVEKMALVTKMELIYSYPLAFRPLSQIMEMNFYSVCAIHNIIGVIASGHYSLCGIGSNEPDLVFGKIGEKSLREIWNNNQILNNLRSELHNELNGICGKCIMKPRCMGYCRAHNYYRTGDIYSSHWICELADNAGLFPRIRLK